MSYFPSTKDYGIEIIKGRIPDTTYINKFGRNSTTVTNDAIWSASTPYLEPVTAAICNVVSTHADDSPTGTGASAILITGIDGNWDIVSETVTLSGLVTVPTVNKFFSIHRSYVTAAQSIYGLSGDVTITSQASGTPGMGKLLAGYNQTQSTIYVVPRNYTAYIQYVQMTVQSIAVNKQLDIGQFKKDFNGIWRIQNDYLFLSDSGGGYQSKNWYSPLKYEEKSTLLFKCINATDPFDVACDYDIILVAN